jgi:YegS/Rv2252/BmrU family lipid kinase
MTSTSTSTLARTCVIFNPTARGEKAKRLLKHLGQLGTACAFKPTLAAGDARPLAAEAVREGCQTVVAVGGDGTVNEVINGIADEPEGFQRIRLGVLPVGTVNVFARELGLPSHFRDAWQVILRGHEAVIDLPQVEFQTRTGLQRRWFAQMAGCGLDARAVELMNWELKKKIGQFAYVVSALKALAEKATQIHISDGTRTFTGELTLLGNGRLYGGSIPMFHQADLRDGLLDVCVFPCVNWFVVLRYAGAFLSPKLLFRGGEHYFQAKSVTVDGGTPAPLELDGEHVGHMPATFSIRKTVLRVLVPHR